MRSVWIGFMLIASPATVSVAQAAGRPPVDTIVARYLATRGGADRIRNTRSIRLVGHMDFGAGATGVDTIEMARPVRIRTVVHLAQGTLVQAYDGTTAWGINPFDGDSTARVLDGGTTKNVIAGADLDGPLLDYRARGITITLAGLDTAQGRPAWALTVVRPDSTVDTYFIDSTSYQLTRWQGHRVADGVPVIYETYFSHYLQAGGMWFPGRLESHTLGRPGRQVIVVDAVAVDLPVHDAWFEMPHH